EVRVGSAPKPRALLHQPLESGGPVVLEPRDVVGAHLIDDENHRELRRARRRALCRGCTSNGGAERNRDSHTHPRKSYMRRRGSNSKSLGWGGAPPELGGGGPRFCAADSHSVMS